jgi:hypothetical protein
VCLGLSVLLSYNTGYYHSYFADDKSGTLRSHPASESGNWNWNPHLVTLKLVVSKPFRPWGDGRWLVLRTGGSCWRLFGSQSLLLMPCMKLTRWGTSGHKMLPWSIWRGWKWGTVPEAVTCQWQSCWDWGLVSGCTQTPLNLSREKDAGSLEGTAGLRGGERQICWGG